VGREEDAALARDEMLPRNAPMSGTPDVFGMCSQFVGAGACDSVLVAVGEGTRWDKTSVGKSSGSGSIGMWAMRARACRSGCCGCGRRDRGCPGSKSGEGGRAENDLSAGAKRRENGRESVVGVCGGRFDWVVVRDCTRVDPKWEDPNSELGSGSGSRRGTDASTERMRLWASRRLCAVVDVPSLEVELWTCLGRRLDALRRANGTITRTRATIKIKPPMAATTMMASLLLSDDDDDVVVDGPAVRLHRRLGQMTTANNAEI
jgi:hypothetical protein